MNRPIVIVTGSKLHDDKSRQQRLTVLGLLKGTEDN
jgi:hypothetical protein